MNKLYLFLMAVLMGVLVLSGLFAGSAQAGQDSDAWTRVHADWPYFHGYYKANSNGVVHEKWYCDSNWRDCIGTALYFPTDKFAEAPSNTPCGADMSLFLWEGTIEFSDDEGDASDFLVIGREYWFCNLLGYEEFRNSE